MSANFQDWKVLRLKPRTEKCLADLCRAHGVEYYLPMRKVERVYASKKKTVELPIFPGYIFCAAGSGAGKRMLTQQHYTLRAINPYSPVRLLRQLVAVRRMLKENPQMDRTRELAVGLRVRVLSGPMRHHEGYVKQLRSSTKVTLVLDEIGEAIPVTIAGKDLQLV